MCATLRGYDSLRDSKKSFTCELCPAREKSEYGWIVRGCRIKAQEICNIGKFGGPWRKSNARWVKRMRAQLGKKPPP